MKRSGYCNRNGLTLIEVVAATALIGMLLVSILIGFTAHTRQIKRANQSLAATKLLDQQIAVWFSSENGFPRNESGIFAENTDLRWATQVLPAEGLDEKWNAVKLRVIVTDISNRNSTELSGNTEIVAECELLIKKRRVDHEPSPE